MEDIDSALRRLSGDRVPSRLAQIDAQVLERVAGHRFGTHHDIGQFRVMAVAAALFMGIAGGMLPEEPAGPKPSLSPLSGATDLAPSTLLTTIQ